MKSFFYLSLQVHAVQESSEKCGTLLPALIRRTLSPALFRRTLSPTLFESHPASEKRGAPFSFTIYERPKRKYGMFESLSLAKSISMGWFSHEIFPVK
jgi:hypothetical protein